MHTASRRRVAALLIRYEGHNVVGMGYRYARRPVLIGGGWVTKGVCRLGLEFGMKINSTSSSERVAQRVVYIEDCDPAEDSRIISLSHRNSFKVTQELQY